MRPKGYKLSEEAKLAVSKANKGRPAWNKGIKTPLSVRKKLSVSKKGRKAWNKNIPCREETKQKIKEKMVLKLNRKFKDTSIELKIEKELQKKNIYYKKQVPLCKIAIVDFYLPNYRIVIQADGCYWHDCPKHGNGKFKTRKEKDEMQDRILTYNGFNVYRFWECDIESNVSECLNKINFG